jgi:hypothetical protein
MEKVVVELEAKTGKAEASLQGVIDAINDLSKANVDSQKETKKSMKSLEGSSKSLSKGFKGVGLAMKAAGFAIVMKVVGKLGEALMSNKTVVDAMSVAFETVSIVLKKITDVFVDVFKSVSEATGGFDALQKVIGGALTIAVSSISLVIQGLILGVKKAQLAWEDSFLGGKDPEKIKELNLSITEVQGNLIKTADRIKNAGKDIATNFVEALTEVGSLAEGVVVATTKAIEEIDLKQAISDGKRLANAKKNFERLAQEQARLVEKYDLQAEQQRQIRDDESKTIAERISANNLLGEILLKQNEAEKKTVKSRINALQEETRLKGTSVELSNEIFELQTEMIAIDAKVAGFQSEQQTNINSLKKENAEITNSQLESESNLSVERKRFNAELIEDELLKLERLREVEELFQEQEEVRLQSIVDNANFGTQAKVDAQIALDTFIEESRQTNLTKNKEIAVQEVAVAKAAADAKKAILAAQLNTVGAGFALLGQMAGKNKTLQAAALVGEAAVSIAKMVAANNLANIGALATPQAILTAGVSAIPVIALNNISTGIGIASTIAATAKGLGSLGGGGSTPTASRGGTAPTPSIASAPPAFNLVGQSDTNQLADVIGGQSQQPTRAYVVSSDVTTSQEMDRNIVTGASL